MPAMAVDTQHGIDSFLFPLDPAHREQFTSYTLAGYQQDR
jgi:hypothetical protein